MRKQKKEKLKQLRVRVQGDEADKLRSSLRNCYNDLTALLRHAKKELNTNETYSSAKAGVRFRHLLRRVNAHVSLLLDASLKHDRFIAEMKRGETTKQKTKAYRRNLNAKRKALKAGDVALVRRSQKILKNQAEKRKISRSNKQAVAEVLAEEDILTKEQQ